MFDGVRTILPPGAMLAGGEIGPDARQLFPIEQRRASVMSPKRRLEFAAGRHYGRQALRALGLPPAPIPTLPSRAPAWPQGIVGSISHNRTACLAVAARGPDLVSIGIDLEGADPLPPELVPMICRPGDLKNRSNLEHHLSIDLPKLVFVLKEAFYKAYHPIAGYFLDFPDVEVTVQPHSSAFEARLVTSHSPSCAGRRALAGRFGRAGDLLFAVTWLPA